MDSSADAKTPRAPSDEEEDDDDDLFSLLEQEREAAAVTFTDDPYSSLLVFQSSTSYVTINGNEESCGSSFSDFGTSLMASVHISGFRFGTKAKPEEDEVVLPLIPTFPQVMQDFLLPLNS